MFFQSVEVAEWGRSEGGRDIWIAAQRRRKNSAEWKVCTLFCTIFFKYSYCSATCPLFFVLRSIYPWWNNATRQKKGFLSFISTASLLKIIKMYREKTSVENVCSYLSKNVFIRVQRIAEFKIIVQYPFTNMPKCWQMIGISCREKWRSLSNVSSPSSLDWPLYKHLLVPKYIHICIATQVPGLIVDCIKSCEEYMGRGPCFLAVVFFLSPTPLLSVLKARLHHREKKDSETGGDRC